MSVYCNTKALPAIVYQNSTDRAWYRYNQAHGDLVGAPKLTLSLVILNTMNAVVQNRLC